MYMEFYKLNHEVNKKDLKHFSYPNQKLGVIIHVENEKGEILLQQRGPNSRDENGMFEDIGDKGEVIGSGYQVSIPESTGPADVQYVLLPEVVEIKGNSPTLSVGDVSVGSD